MSFFDALFGHQKPVPAGPERIFGMSTAMLPMQAELNLQPSGIAAMCFRDIGSGPFAQMQKDLDRLLALSAKDADDPVTYKTERDDLGFTWLIFRAKDMQSVITVLHMVSTTFLEQGYGSQLLFGVFPFTGDDGRHVYWMYNYKHGTFYPFVPQTDTHDRLRRRNNAEELRLATAMKKELQVEDKVESWYPVWDMPL